jgi:hypothetical protein
VSVLSGDLRTLSYEAALYFYPAGPLGVTMRLYALEPSVLDGTWSPPPVRRAEAVA